MARLEFLGIPEYFEDSKASSTSSDHTNPEVCMIKSLPASFNHYFLAHLFHCQPCLLSTESFQIKLVSGADVRKACMMVDKKDSREHAHAMRKQQAG